MSFKNGESTGFGERELSRSDDLSNVSPEGELAIQDIFEEIWVAVVRLGLGCGGGCITCGAFQDLSARERRSFTISLDQLIDNLTQEVGVVRAGVRQRMVDLCRSIVITGVDTEPADSDIFNQAARLIYLLSNREKRFVMISHGGRCVEGLDGEQQVWRMNPAQSQRLRETAQLMKEDIVPLFVLSMDLARDGGLAGRDSKELDRQLKQLETEDTDFMKLVKFNAREEQLVEGIIDPLRQETKEEWLERVEVIKLAMAKSVARKMEGGVSLNDDEERTVKPYVLLQQKLLDSVIEANARSYAETIDCLMPAIRVGKRVTFSLQGERDARLMIMDEMSTIKLFGRTLQILKEEYGIDEGDLQELIGRADLLAPLRRYISAGRARNILGITDEEREATVIPDQDFVHGPYLSDPPKPLVGVLNPDGSLVAASWKLKRFYNQLVKPSSFNWRRVCLGGEEKDFDIKPFPTDLLEKMDFRARTRRKVPLPTKKQELAVQGIGEVYPLSLIEDPEVLEGLILRIGRMDGVVADIFKRRRHIIGALIDGEEIERYRQEGETDEQLLDRIITIIVEKFTPEFLRKKGSVSRGRVIKMGEVLAILGLLRNLGINVAID